MVRTKYCDIKTRGYCTRCFDHCVGCENYKPPEPKQKEVERRALCDGCILLPISASPVCSSCQNHTGAMTVNCSTVLGIGLDGVCDNYKPKIRTALFSRSQPAAPKIKGHRKESCALNVPVNPMCEVVCCVGCPHFEVEKQPELKDGFWYVVSSGTAVSIPVKDEVMQYQMTAGGPHDFVFKPSRGCQGTMISPAVASYRPATFDDLSIELAGKACWVHRYGEDNNMVIHNEAERYLYDGTMINLGNGDTALDIAKKLGAPVICTDQWQALTRVTP